MSKLEELKPNAALRGIVPDSLVTVVSVQWFGSEALELTYKTPAGKVANEFLYRHDETRLEVVEQGRPWSFDGDGALFRLVSEAHRIRLAHLFDPVLAVHTFPKYISDAFEGPHARTTAARTDGASPEDLDEYRAENNFWVPKAPRSCDLRAKAKPATVGGERLEVEQNFPTPLVRPPTSDSSKKRTRREAPRAKELLIAA